MNATPPAIRLALCIDAAKFAWFIPGGGNNLLDIGAGQIETMETRLIDRAVCEKDESTLQLLPYNVLVNEDGKVFRYLRGDGGAESRLHDKYSIGIGGHVDIAPGVDDWSLTSMLQLEAIREITEEVGVQWTGMLPVFTHYLMDYSNPVGRVHLGLLSVNLVHSSQIGTLEEGMILKGEWVEVEDLFASEEEFLRLENWSQSVAQHLHRLKHDGRGVDFSLCAQ
jgi:predicted NUDIX family phosphoesterase